jgi:hypothetical protein
MNHSQADKAIATLRATSAAQGKPIIYQSDLDIDDAYLHGTLNDAPAKIKDRFYWLLRAHGTELYVPIAQLDDPAAALTYTIIATRFWTNDPETSCYVYDIRTGLHQHDRDALIKLIIKDTIGYLEPARINAAIKAADDSLRGRGPARATFRVVGQAELGSARVVTYPPANPLPS